MNAEAVVLHVFAPVHVDALRALGADAVAPMIIVGEAAAWPAQNVDAQFFQIIDSGFSIAVDVRDGRVFSYPQASVDAGAEVFGKVSMKLGTDDANRIFGMDRDAFGFRVGGDEAPRNERGEGDSGRAAKKMASGRS